MADHGERLCDQARTNERVTLFPFVKGMEADHARRRRTARLRASTHACRKSYSLPTRLTTVSASWRRSLSSSPVARNTQTRRAPSCDSRIGRTPAAMSASTMQSGSDASSSGPTYMETCDHVDRVTRSTSAAQRVFPALSRTSPRSSTVGREFADPSASGWPMRRPASPGRARKHGRFARRFAR